MRGLSSSSHQCWAKFRADQTGARCDHRALPSWRHRVYDAQDLDYAVLADCQLLEKLLQFADDTVRHSRLRSFLHLHKVGPRAKCDLRLA